MSEAFLSSDDFDEQAHQLYNEARYDEALALLREGLSLYPSSVELHIGSAYAWMAMEEFAWSRRSFSEAAQLYASIREDLTQAEILRQEYARRRTILVSVPRAGAMKEGLA